MKFALYDITQLVSTILCVNFFTKFLLGDRFVFI